MCVYGRGCFVYACVLEFVRACWGGGCLRAGIDCATC